MAFDWKTFLRPSITKVLFTAIAYFVLIFFIAFVLLLSSPDLVRCYNDSRCADAISKDPSGIIFPSLQAPLGYLVALVSFDNWLTNIYFNIVTISVIAFSYLLSCALVHFFMSKPATLAKTK